MAYPSRKHRWTAEEYLAFERQSPTRHELIDGEIYDMAGASLEHNTINANVVMTLGVQLRGQACRVLSSDMRVKLGKANYSYPDIVVVCGKPEFEDKTADTLINPTVVFLILSPTTERYDRGEKFQHYRALSALQAYILVSQDAPRLEVYTRQPDGGWALAEYVGLDQRLTIPAIGCDVALTDVYDRVF